MNPTTMRAKNLSSLIYINANPYVNSVGLKTNSGRVLSKRILTQQVVAVYPRGELAGARLQTAVDCVALAGIRFANPII